IQMMSSGSSLTVLSRKRFFGSRKTLIKCFSRRQESLRRRLSHFLSASIRVRPIHCKREQPVCARASELRAQARAEHRYWSAVAVVGGIDDELIVERHPPAEDREAVVHLQDPLGSRIRQDAVTHEDAEAAGIEKRLV